MLVTVLLWKEMAKPYFHYKLIILLGVIKKSYKQTRFILKTDQPNSLSYTHIAVLFSLL